MHEWRDVGPAALDEYFRSAARFWRARPWELADDEEAFLARCGTREAVVVLTHPRGHGHAVTIYTSGSDYPEEIEPAHPVFGVQFTGRTRMARLLDLHLPVTPAHPGPRPYPLLLESRGSDGPSTLQLRLVSALLSALAELGKSRTRVSRELRFMAENGVELRNESEARRLRWPAMKRACPGCAAGAAADPGAAGGSARRLERSEQERVERFAAYLKAARPRPWSAARNVRHASVPQPQRDRGVAGPTSRRLGRARDAPGPRLPGQAYRLRPFPRCGRSRRSRTSCCGAGRYGGTRRSARDT